MRISSMLYSPSYHTSQPSFKSNNQAFFNSSGKVVNKTVTSMFRDDFAWTDFAEILALKYKNTNKINITNYACSDGSEPISLAIAITEFAPQIANKAFPIIAKDKSQHILNYAQSGIYNIYDSDIYSINHFTKNKLSNYFTPVSATILGCPMALKPKKLLQDKIIYQQADILEDLKNLPDENNVILCRNFWTYLGKEHFHKLAEKLYEKTKNNGLIVIGQLDNGHGIPSILRQHGFKETYINNVYKPID